MRVLGFGTYDAERHPRIGVILDGLREHGDEVVEANVPLGFDTARASRWCGGRGWPTAWRCGWPAAGGG